MNKLKFSNLRCFKKSTLFSKILNIDMVKTGKKIKYTLGYGAGFLSKDVTTIIHKLINTNSMSGLL